MERCHNSDPVRGEKLIGLSVRVSTFDPPRRSPVCDGRLFLLVKDELFLNAVRVTGGSYEDGDIGYCEHAIEVGD